MTALGLARASDALAAGVDYSGILITGRRTSQSRSRCRTAGGGILPHRDHRPVALTRAACAGGTRQRCTLPAAAELIEGLRSHNIDHDVIMIPNEIHDMTRYSSWMMCSMRGCVLRSASRKRSAPLRKQVITSVLIDGVWALRFVFEEPVWRVWRGMEASPRTHESGAGGGAPPGGAENG